MTLLSLQAIIEKYGARYGIDPKAALKAPAKDAAAEDPKQTDAGKEKIPLADSVKLSPAAKDFLAAHTGPLGKFEMPNVMNDFFDALNGTDQTGSDTGNGLLDFLSGATNGNQADGSSGSPFNFRNPLGTGGTGNTAGDSAPKSLLDFL